LVGEADNCAGASAVFAPDRLRKGVVGSMRERVAIYDKQRPGARRTGGPASSTRLRCDWHNVVRVSFMLHKSEKPQSVLDIAAAIVPVPLENAEIELVEGYSTPGKLVEIEVTARR
jgi:hypothetical protein